MSRRINVNPGQYKVAGRERQGEDIVHQVHKSQLAERSAGLQRKAGGRRPAAARKKR